jgi:hypothetical protein
MPALTVSLAELAGAVESIGLAEGRRLGRIDWRLDEHLQAAADSWPSTIIATEAQRFGIRAEASAVEILRSILEDYPLQRDDKASLAPSCLAESAS